MLYIAIIVSKNILFNSPLLFAIINLIFLDQIHLPPQWICHNLMETGDTHALFIITSLPDF